MNRAVDRDGQLVSETTRVTSANGLSIHPVLMMTAMELSIGF